MASIDAKPEVCRDFLRHACKRGSRCRFRHESAGGAGRSTSGGPRHDGCRLCFELFVDGVDRQLSAADDDDDVAERKDDDDVIVEINTPRTST